MVIGGDSLVAASNPPRSSSRYFYFTTGAALILAILFSWYSTGDLISSYETMFREFFQIIEQKKTEQKNFEAMKTLSEQRKSIEKNQKSVAKAIPEKPRPDQVVRMIEYLIDKTGQKMFMGIPDNMVWRAVSENDISNDDLAALGVTEYVIPFIGQYEALEEFLKTLRQNLQIIDVRSVSGVQLQRDGFTKADIVFWTYHLIP